jgi:hypothetical protein
VLLQQSNEDREMLLCSATLPCDSERRQMFDEALKAKFNKATSSRAGSTSDGGQQQQLYSSHNISESDQRPWQPRQPLVKV